jgi:hypothetical protein
LAQAQISQPFSSTAKLPPFGQASPQAWMFWQVALGFMGGLVGGGGAGVAGAGVTPILTDVLNVPHTAIPLGTCGLG